MTFFKTSCFLLLVSIILTAAFSCRKNNPTHAAVGNCDGLITDTAGTSDHAYIVMANAFTPNGDGINDSYGPAFYNIASFDYKLYDAAGNVVFSTTTFGQEWAPATNSASSQTFYYRIQAVTKNNHSLGTCGEVRLLTCLPRDSVAYFYFNDQLDPGGHFALPTADRISRCP